ncbi:TrkA C-terminal domain-containing protein [Gordonia sp. VNQ95]|jgi:putative transport protein|uniref:aspartate:alanine exchanger family transporter n=1 Tax=Gordonia TaxID=2053 RepID=UPI0032B414F8
MDAETIAYRWEAAMTAVLDLLADQPLLYLMIVIGLGVAIGRITIRGIGLGPAAVLFSAIALTAFAKSMDVDITIPEIIGNLGLILFAFTTGLMAGPNFFASLRTAWKLVVTVTVVIAAAAVTVDLVGSAFHMSTASIAGTFAGALTNTPALAAAGGSAEATIGYATSYILGVILMLVMVAIAFRYGNPDPDTPPEVVDITVRLESDDVTVTELRERHGNRLTFSRLAHDPDEPPVPITDDQVLHRGDLITVIGPRAEVDALIDEIGHRSIHDLTADRSKLDFRRITISSPELAGRKVRELDLDSFDGSITRLRRGDTDMVATPATTVQLGDRVRVVAPPENMAKIARMLGDSSRGLTELNAAAMGFGIALGLAVGLIPIPIPGLGTLSLGAAAGSLIVGLILGRIGRIGPFVTTMPITSAQVITEVGLLLFLAYAGTRAGSLILDAFTSGAIVDILVTGAITSAVMAVGMYAACRFILGVGRIRLAGVLAGTQTNPAHLAFANARGGDDPRIALGYALVYPAAMVVKILLAQVLSTL